MDFPNSALLYYECWYSFVEKALIADMSELVTDNWNYFANDHFDAMEIAADICLAGTIAIAVFVDYFVMMNNALILVFDLPIELNLFRLVCSGFDGVTAGFVVDIGTMIQQQGFLRNTQILLLLNYAMQG